MHRLIVLVALLVLALSACAEKSSAPQTIENYLKAKMSGDEKKLVDLSCPAREEEARAEAASFQSVDAKLDNLKCQAAGKDGDYTLVTCTGTIVIQYRGEDPRSQGLPDITYRALKVDNEWTMCGTQ